MTLRHRARVGFAALACVGLALSIAPTASATTGTLAITGDTTLTEDHLGNVVVAADGVTLDCAEHSISGGGFAGIRVDFRRGVREGELPELAGGNAHLPSKHLRRSRPEQRPIFETYRCRYRGPRVGRSGWRRLRERRDHSGNGEHRAHVNLPPSCPRRQESRASRDYASHATACD